MTHLEEDRKTLIDVATRWEFVGAALPPYAFHCQRWHGESLALGPLAAAAGITQEFKTAMSQLDGAFTGGSKALPATGELIERVARLFGATDQEVAEQMRATRRELDR